MNNREDKIPFPVVLFTILSIALIVIVISYIPGHTSVRHVNNISQDSCMKKNSDILTEEFSYKGHVYLLISHNEKYGFAAIHPESCSCGDE